MSPTLISFKKALGKTMKKGRWVIFIVPCFVILLSLNIFPLIYSLWLAFHDWTITSRAAPPFVGFGNFLKLAQDGRFGNSLVKTFLYISISVSAQFLLGLAIALALSAKYLQGSKVFRTIVTIPMMIAPLVVGYTFRLLFHPSSGPINHLLSLVGVGWVDWVGSSKLSLYSIIIADIWAWTPLMALILWSGIYSLPVEILEAAKVDGASSWVLFRLVMLPMLVPIILVCFMLRIVDAFRMFDVAYILTGGGPGISSELASLYTYKVGFSFFKLGYASAISYVLLIISVVIINQFFKKFLIQR